MPAVAEEDRATKGGGVVTSRDLTVRVDVRELEPVRDLIYAVSKYLDGRLVRWIDDIAGLRAALETANSPYYTSHSTEAVHDWFGLSYANFLVLHRTLLQQMDAAWQQRFVRCLEELFAVPWDVELPAGYRVSCVDESSKFTSNPVPHYRRGRVGRKDVPL